MKYGRAKTWKDREALREEMRRKGIRGNMAWWEVREKICEDFLPAVFEYIQEEGCRYRVVKEVVCVNVTGGSIDREAPGHFLARMPLGRFASCKARIGDCLLRKYEDNIHIDSDGIDLVELPEPRL